MGVKGLWQLVESSGRPVTLESLESKILAVDVSIWLNQAVRGCRDRQGGPMQNAHLLTLFNRICKLLFYRIKPVFVFDGGVPILKKQTLAARRQRKDVAAQESRRTSQKLLMSLVRSQAVRKKLKDSSEGDDGTTSNTSNLSEMLPKSSKQADMFELPPLSEEMQKELASSDEEDLDALDNEGDTFLSQMRRGFQDLDSVDVNSVEFRAMPPEIQHEILSELKEQRKKNSWAKIDEMPEDSPSFSSFQMARLLKRRSLQQRLEEVQKDMMTRNSDQSILEMMGGSASTSTETVARRIASDENTQYILIKGLKKGGSLIDRSSNDLISTLEANAARNERSMSVKIADNSLEKDETASNSRKSPLVEAGSSTEVDERLEDNDVVMLSPKDAVDSTVETLGFLQEVAARSTLKSPTTVVNADEGFARLRTIMPEFVDISETSEEQKFVSSELKAASSSTVVHNENSNHMPDSTSNVSSFADFDSKLPVRVHAITCHEVHSVSDESNSSDVVLLEDIPASNSANKVSVIRAAVSTSLQTPVLNDRPSASLESEAEKKEDIREVTTVSSGSDEDSDGDFIEVLSSTTKQEEQDFLPEAILKRSVDLEKESEAVSSTSEPSIINPAANKSEDKLQVAEVCEPQSSGLEEQKHPIDLSIVESEQEAPAKDDGLSSMTSAELEKLDNDLLDEQIHLTKEKAKQDRIASSISDQMYAESQEMLRLFGVPYVVSPMEAEAQCATLDQLKLTHGTVTDDSDVWLFGGQQVYKNFFNQNKHVEFYKASEIKNHFGLDRINLISIALMTGSDYTDGIDGVGYVTALEILGEFPGEGIKPLQAFREWWEESQKQVKIPTESKVKQKLRHLVLHPGFPNDAVVNAYLEPTVDESTEKFTWGMPDLDALRDFAQSRFGWSRGKADEALLPVIKRLNEKSIQTKLDSFFQVSTSEKDVDSRSPSKRVRRALNKVSKATVDEPTQPEEDPKIKAKKVIQRKRKIGAKDSSDTSEAAGNGDGVTSSRAAVSSKTVIARGKGKRGRGSQSMKPNLLSKRTPVALQNEAQLSEESSLSS